jgi:hypothetical protein
MCGLPRSSGAANDSPQSPPLLLWFVRASRGVAWEKSERWETHRARTKESHRSLFQTTQAYSAVSEHSCKQFEVSQMMVLVC